MEIGPKLGFKVIWYGATEAEGIELSYRRRINGKMFTFKKVTFPEGVSLWATNYSTRHLLTFPTESHDV